MGNRYSLSEYMKNIYSFVMTKLTMRKARLIRRPVYMRGKKSFTGGVALTTGRFCRFDLQGEKPTLFVGENCELGDMTHIVAHERVYIGNNVLIASKSFISDTSHGNYKGDIQDNPISAPNARKLITNPVTIGNNVWIGENAVILAGAEIGDGCIIGANTVITKRIPEKSIVVGCNQIIKRWNDDTNSWENKES